MTDDAWERLSVMLGSWWGQPWDARKSEAYRLALDRFEPGQVVQALEAAGRKDPKWRPGALELVAAIEGPGPSHPSPDEAWALLQRAVRRVGVSAHDLRFRERHQAAIDWLARRDPVLADFAAARGLTGSPEAIGMLPVSDPERGGVVLATLKKDWAGRVAQAQERESAGLLGTEPTLDRSGEPRRLGAGLPGLGVGDG